MAALQWLKHVKDKEYFYCKIHTMVSSMQEGF